MSLDFNMTLKNIYRAWYNASSNSVYRIWCIVSDTYQQFNCWDDIPDSFKDANVYNFSYEDDACYFEIFA